MEEVRSTPILEAYLRKRADLVRFFMIRLRSQAAAEDLVQELYLKVCALDDAVDVKNPNAFLYRLGANLMLDRLRRDKRSAERDGDWYLMRRVVAGREEAANEPAPDDAVAARQRLRQIAAAVEGLPPQARRAFELHKLRELSHAETAATMGISVSAVEKLISSAMKRLIARLG